jgi:modification methylase
MLELNKIYNVDVLDGLKQLDDESIDLIITSPPYNKVGLNGMQKGLKWNKTIDYNDDPNNDNMLEEDYQNWQVEILKECYRVLKKDGSMFYNHKNRIHEGEIITPYQWIFKSPFKIRQEIIWDRGSGQNVNRCRYIPTTELIFWLVKSKRPRFDRGRDTLFKNEVWRFRFEVGTEHPAPFPIELPNNIIPCVSKGERITVLDPFMGSGTVAISAIANGCDYIGFEKFKKYVDMANEKLKSEG